MLDMFYGLLPTLVAAALGAAFGYFLGIYDASRQDRVENARQRESKKRRGRMENAVRRIINALNEANRPSVCSISGIDPSGELLEYTVNVVPAAERKVWAKPMSVNLKPGRERAPIEVRYDGAVIEPLSFTDKGVDRAIQHLTAYIEQLRS